MMDQVESARRFAELHVPGRPLVLFNIWDAGSAQAVVRSGARAVATGSASVAAANGFADGEQLPVHLVYQNAERICDAVDLPVTIDFEGAYAAEPDDVAANVARLAETGAVGCNFEDQVVGAGTLYPIARQYPRIAAIRALAPSGFFINARTDLFLKTRADAHDRSLADHALQRAQAYADAGANGIFVPGLIDLQVVERICESAPLPVNVMSWIGGPSVSEWASAGVARISFGSDPYLKIVQWLEDFAREEVDGRTA